MQFGNCASEIWGLYDLGPAGFENGGEDLYDLLQGFRYMRDNLKSRSDEATSVVRGTSEHAAGILC